MYVCREEAAFEEKEAPIRRAPRAPRVGRHDREKLVALSTRKRWLPFRSQHAARENNAIRKAFRHVAVRTKTQAETPKSIFDTDAREHRLGRSLHRSPVERNRIDS